MSLMLLLALRGKREKVAGLLWPSREAILMFARGQLSPRGARKEVRK